MRRGPSGPPSAGHRCRSGESARPGRVRWWLSRIGRAPLSTVHRMPAVGLDGNHADIAMLAEERSSDERVA
jgi:hypothetical protein